MTTYLLGIVAALLYFIWLEVRTLRQAVQRQAAALEQQERPGRAWWTAAGSNN